MKIFEVFSAIGAPREEENDVNWKDDLKFFIDNDNDVLSNVMFPAIKKHQHVGDHPDAYKIYIKPLQKCSAMYMSTFDVPEDKITKGDLIELARRIAEEQNVYIKNGDYEN
jgi:hypothetical protein